MLQFLGDCAPKLPVGTSISQTFWLQSHPTKSFQYLHWLHTAADDDVKVTLVDNAGALTLHNMCTGAGLWPQSVNLFTVTGPVNISLSQCSVQGAGCRAGLLMSHVVNSYSETPAHSFFHQTLTSRLIFITIIISANTS